MALGTPERGATFQSAFCVLPLLAALAAPFARARGGGSAFARVGRRRMRALQCDTSLQFADTIVSTKRSAIQGCIVWNALYDSVRVQQLIWRKLQPRRKASSPLAVLQPTLQI